MTPRQEKLDNAAKAVDAAKQRIERIIPTLEMSVADAWQRDVAALDLASKTVMAVAEDPESFGKLMEFRAKKPKEFAAFMLWVNEELKPTAPADAKAAA